MNDATKTAPGGPRILHSGGWRVDPARGVIAQGGRETRLEPKVMDVLVCLLERAGEVVSRDELLAAAWSGRFVTEEVLTVAIFELRRALGDDARAPRFVETIPKRGYRWKLEVTLRRPPSRRPGGRRRIAATAAAALGLAAALLFAVCGGDGRGAARSSAAEAEAQRARLQASTRDPHGLRQALDGFTRAASMDERFAPAYAGAARAGVLLADMNVGDRRELALGARAAAERALALDGELADAHAALGLVRLLVDWDFSRAEESLRRALALDPRLADGHQAYSWLLSAGGRHPEAVAHARTAQELDPASVQRRGDLAWALAYAGRTGEALAVVEAALAQDPGYFRGYVTKGLLLDLEHRPAEAFAAFRDGYLRLPRGADIVDRLETARRREGLRGVYRVWLEATRRGSPNLPQSGVWLAALSCRLGETEQALALLERAFTEREGGLAWLRVEPSFAALHGQPRFERLAARLGLRG